MYVYARSSPDAKGEARERVDVQSVCNMINAYTDYIFSPIQRPIRPAPFSRFFHCLLLLLLLPCKTLD